MDFLEKKKTQVEEKPYYEQEQIENEFANAPMEQVQNNVNQELVPGAREKALDHVKKMLEMQNSFQVEYKKMNLEESKQELEKEEEYNSKLTYLEEEEKELKKLKEKYEAKEEINTKDAVQCAKADIFKGYYHNQYGDVNEQIVQKQQQRESLKQRKEQNEKDIVERIAQYKANSETELADRQKRINETFEKESMSSKNKKEKGRKKGAALKKSGVIGATEETYAMLKDMNEQQKKVDKWKKKHPKIKSEEIELTGHEFDVVFKNKSGSALNIKAVQEKIAKLYIKAGDSTEEEALKYKTHADMLDKVLKVVCAANGIEFDGKNYKLFDKEDKTAAEKVEYANAVYASVMAEYEEKVKQIQNGTMIYGEQQKTEQKAVVEKKEETKTEEQLEKDKRIFRDIMSGLRKKEDDKVSDEVWQAAINICSSYDHSKFIEKEEPLLVRKEELQKETEFLNRLVEGDTTSVFKFVAGKLEELAKKGITIEKCMEQEEVEKNLQGYTELASAIQIMNYVRQNLDEENIKIVLGTNSFFQNKMALMEFLIDSSNLSDYDKYVAGVRNYANLDDRKKKVLKNRAHKTKQKNERLKSELRAKAEKVGMEKLVLSDLESEDLETQLDNSALTDVYDENVVELQSYVDELKARATEIEKKKNQYQLITEIGSAVKMYMTAAAMKKINQKRMSESVQDIERMKKNKVESKVLEKDEKKEKSLEIFRANLKAYSAYAGQKEILENLIANMKNMSDKEIYEKVLAIKKIRPDSNAEERFEKYQAAKGKDVVQSEYERQILLAKMDYRDCDEEQKENNKQKYLALREIYHKEYEKEESWDEAKVLAELEESKSLWGKMFGTNVNKDYAQKVNSIQKKIQEMNRKVDENGEEIVEEDSAYGSLLTYFKESLERQKREAQKKYTKVKEYMKENKDDFEYIMERLTEDEIALYLEKKDEKLLAVSDHIEDLLENSERELAQNIEKYVKEFGTDEIDNIVGMQEFLALNSELKSISELQKNEETREIAESMLEKTIESHQNITIGQVDEQREDLQKINAEWEKLQKTIADAEGVLKDAKAEAEVAETQEELEEQAKEAYEANRKYINACFAGRTEQSAKSKIVDAVTNAIKGEKSEQGLANNNKILETGVESDFIQTYRAESEKLIKEKDGKGEFGITYNTLAIQNFLTDTSEDKYERIHAENLFDKKHKKKNDYQITKDDFTMAVMQEGKGITTINFQRLMYKRNKLMEWVNAHKHLEAKEHGKWYKDAWDKARSIKQQRYDRRLERLEKLNNYLKCYSEANGIDFVTGELFCESDMPADEIKEKVKKANLYLSQAMTDIWKYMEISEVELDDPEEPEEEEKIENPTIMDKLKKKWEEISEHEKKILEPYSNQQKIEMQTVLKSWEKAKDISVLEHKARKRTAHFTGDITTKILECQAAMKASVGIGEVTDKKTGESYKSFGGQMQGAASVSVLSSEFLAKYQTKLLGMEASAHAQGKIEVGKASANVNLKAVLLDDKGKFNPALQLALGAELALVNLEGSIGGQILGVGLEAELGLMVGLAARFNLEINGGVVKFDMAAALGVGFTCQLQFDFGGLLDKIKEVAKTKSVKAKDLVLDTLISLGVGINSDFVRNHLLEKVNAIDFDIMQFEREEEQQQEQQKQQEQKEAPKVEEQNNKEQVKKQE